MNVPENECLANLDPVHQTVLAYERIANIYTRLWFDDPVMEPDIDKFLKYIELPGEILDAGCGPGRDVLAFANRGINATGVDLSPAMIEEASLRVPDSVFRLMDLRNLKYPPHTFVGIWACASFHHLPEKDAVRVMMEFARVLKPGGILSVTVEEGQGEYFDQAGRYRKFYTVSDLRQLIILAGFEILEERLTQSMKGTLENNRSKTWVHAYARRVYDALRDDSSEPDCSFCWESRFQLCRKIGIPASESILWGNGELYVFPALAPIIEGHLLIVSTSHHICFGACSEDLDMALLLTQGRIRQLLKEVYQQPTLFFEHGPAMPKLAGACIDHAHIHCLPLTLPVKQTVEQLVGEGQRASFDTLRYFYQAGCSYLYIEDETEGRWVFPVEVVPSQFLRQVVAGLLGHKILRWQESCSTTTSVHLYRSTLKHLLPLADRLWL